LSQPIFNQAPLDPTIIKGIYNTCDQWCMYCPATTRCLAYRSSPAIQSGAQDLNKQLAERLYEGLVSFKRLNNAEGTPTPGVDAWLAGDFREPPPLSPGDEPLEGAAKRYARLSDAYLVSRADFPFAMVWRPTGPTPFEVFAWFHSLIAAKVALIGIDRSLAALTALSADDDDPRLELLGAHLRRLGRELEGRFPEARDFIREGLD
jgi:hypothetical protein